MTTPMDKYEEAAWKVLKNGTITWREASIPDIAAFGRECAAQAYEDAAKSYSEEFGYDNEFHGELLAKAAALRGTK